MTKGFIHRFRSRENKKVGYLFILPSFIHLIVFAAIPLFWSLYLSFHKWSIISRSKPWVGLRNYIWVFTDGDFWNAMKNTIIFAGVGVPLGMTVSLIIALVMNQKLKGVTWFRTIFFLPVIVSMVAIAIVWTWIYDPDFGLLNYFLSWFHIPGVNWLGDPRWALYALIIVNTWKGAGYQMVIFLAGLQGIPETYYEAARIDGASNWRCFWNITLPLLRPTTFFLAITSVIGSLQAFTIVYAMTEGGPLKSTDMVGYHIYQSAFERFTMGYASAQAYVLFAVIFVITLIQVRYMRRSMLQW